VAVWSFSSIRVKSVAKIEEQSILVVDDNPDHRKMFRIRLESGGYSVVEANSGREALAAIEKTRFALIILDLSMYEMDGFAVLRAVRPKHPELKIIVASGFLHGKMLEPAKLLGADATLDKDMIAELLLPMVRNLLENQK
jgi:CheY-like chemotaxis protein